MEDTPNIDVKPSTEAPVPSVTATTAASPADNGEANTPSTPKVETTSLAEIASKFVKERIAESETEKKPSEESQVLESEPTEGEEPKPEVKEEQPVAEDAEPTKEGPVPYARFAEVNKAKSELETRVKEWEPVVQAQQSIVDYCAQNNIDSQSFREALEVTALARRDPAAARAKLLEYANQLGQLDPNVLPADLSARVTEGEMSEAAAKELWKERVENRRNKSAIQQSAQSVQQVEANAIQSSVAAWDASKRASDPAYRPAKNGEIGLRELVERNFAFLVQTKQPRTPNDIIGLLEASYADAKKLFKPAVPASTKPAPSSSRSSQKQNREPQTGVEVAQAVLAQHGVSWSPRK